MRVIRFFENMVCCNEITHVQGTLVGDPIDVIAFE
jgi:magnesium-transporting ATPase (P-type)